MVCPHIRRISIFIYMVSELFSLSLNFSWFNIYSCIYAFHYFSYTGGFINI